MPTTTSTTSAQHINGVADFDYFSFASLLGNSPTSTSATRLQLQQKSIYSYFDSATTLGNYFNYSVAHRRLLSVRPVFTSHRLVLRVPTDGALRPNSVRPVFTSSRLVLRVPTDGALRPNFQYGRCLLVID